MAQILVRPTWSRITVSSGLDTAARSKQMRSINACSSCLQRKSHWRWASRFFATVTDDNRRKRRHSEPNKDPVGDSNSLFSKVDEILSHRRGCRKDPNQPRRSNRLSFPNQATDTRQSHVRTRTHEPSKTTHKSLFEVFKIPDPSLTRTMPNAYETEAWEQYMEFLNPMLQGDERTSRLQSLSQSAEGIQLLEPVRQWLQAKEPTVDCELPSLTLALTAVVPCEVSDQSDQTSVPFSDELHSQRQRFMQVHKLDPKQYAIARGTLTSVVHQCAKQINAQPLPVIWQKVKEAGMTDQRLLHTLLYLAANSSTGERFQHDLVGASIVDVLSSPDWPSSRGDASCSETAPTEAEVELVDEIAAYHDLLYEPTEQTTNVKVRLLVARQQPQEAEQLLWHNADKMDLRLRSFSPIFKLYLELNDVDSALRLYRHMRSLPPVYLDCETYISLLVCLAAQGCFRVDATPIKSATNLGFASSSGPGLLDELLMQMACDITEIPLQSAKRLHNAFAEGFPESGISKIESFGVLPLVSEPAAGSGVVLSRVRIDHNTGICPRTGIKLRLIRLEEEDSHKLKEGIISLAQTQQQKFQDMHKTRDGNQKSKGRADESLEAFLEWLDKREGAPFTTIIDGANVGYFMQNFENGRFSYHQVMFVVDHLERIGETPLVILPYKYSRQHFYITIGAGGSLGSRKQRLTKSEIAIRDQLIQTRKLFIVPRGFLDDYYWILASLSKQTVSRKGRDLFVEPLNAEGRWPGGRPVLVSNDQMRDHKVGMLEPRLFRRWYSNFIVNYSFAGFINDHCISDGIQFSPADFYSREIQGNKLNGAVAWHFPILDTEDEWFCLRLPLSHTS